METTSVTKRSKLTSRDSLDLNSFGKIPPQDVELEIIILGGLLISGKTFDVVNEIISPECFYDEKHKTIYTAICDLYRANDPIDLITVTRKLKEENKLEGVGGAYYISTLSNKVASSANIEFHCRILLQHYIKRKVIEVGMLSTSDAYRNDTDALEVLDNAQHQLNEVTKLIQIGQSQEVGNMLGDIIRLNDELLAKKGVSGVPSGFIDIDRITGGWQKSDLIIVAARPGMGKTAFILSLARNAAVMFDIPVAIFSLEMSTRQLVARLAAQETEIDLEKFMKTGLQPNELTQFQNSINGLASSKIYIDDSPGITPFELKIKARKLKRDKNIQMIFIDYLQLMQPGIKRDNKVQEVSYISQSLKALAKDLDVPIIALSQLSRSVEQRADKIPLLSDLRESGSIEQDADIVAFIYRGEYYGATDENGKTLENEATLIISKHRNGALDSVPLGFKGRFTKFTNFSERFYHTPQSTPLNEIRSKNPDF